MPAVKKHVQIKSM